MITGSRTCARMRAVDLHVVVRALGARRERAAGHQDDPAAAATRSSAHCSSYAASTSASVTLRDGLEVIGARARREDRAGHRLRLGHRALDQLLGRPPVESHAALRGVHRLRDGEPERPEIAPIGERRVPVERDLERRIDGGERIGDDVDGCEGDAASDGPGRRRDRPALRSACRASAVPSGRGSRSVRFIAILLAGQCSTRLRLTVPGARAYRGRTFHGPPPPRRSKEVGMATRTTDSTARSSCSTRRTSRPKWYNIQADLKTPAPPVLHPGTKQPIGPQDLAPLFPMELIKQEVSRERWIAIPEAGSRRLSPVAALARSTARAASRRRSARRPTSTTSTRA